MIYRAYQAEDFGALYAIEEACFRPPLRFGRKYMRCLVESAEAATWIAEENGQMAGFAIVDWAAEVSGAIAYLQTLEVAPQWRRRGVGRELLKRVESSARDAGAETIWLHVDAENDAAIRMYEAHGYGAEGREQDYYAPGRAALNYAKALNFAPVG